MAVGGAERVVTCYDSRGGSSGSAVLGPGFPAESSNAMMAPSTRLRTTRSAGLASSSAGKASRRTRSCWARSAWSSRLLTVTSVAVEMHPCVSNPLGLRRSAVRRGTGLRRCLFLVVFASVLPSVAAQVASQVR